MNKTLKTLAMWACLLGCAAVARAQWTLPTDGHGNPLPTSEAPCVPYFIGVATGTREVVVRGTSQASSSTGNNSQGKTQSYVAWVQLSTGTASMYLKMFDTDKIGSVSDTYQKLPNIVFLGVITGNGTDTAKINTPIAFRPPIRFDYGITAQLSDASTSATICTRAMATQVP